MIAGRWLLVALLVALIPASGSPAGAEASGSTRSAAFDPVRTTPRTIVFRINGVDPEAIRRVRLRLRAYHHRLHRRLVRAYAGRPAFARRRAHRRIHRRLRRTLSPRRVSRAAANRTPLRLRKGRLVRGGRLRVKLAPVARSEDASPPPASPGSCALDLVALSAVGCQTLRSDSGASADPKPLWGAIDCEADSRHQRRTGGADPRPPATGGAAPNDAYRRLTVRDGDDYWGERCELGRNEHRFGSGGGDGTFGLFREGQRRVTFASQRYPSGFPIGASSWQTVMQMKQAQPSAAGGGGPMLEVQLYGGRLRLINDWDQLWSTPAPPAGSWTRIALDVTYSQHADRGRVQMLVDRNGDGDAADSGERSPAFQRSTLRRETGGGSAGDGIAPGESIPSHLRVGVYHSPSIGCGGGGCSVDVDNIQVVKPG